MPTKREREYYRMGFADGRRFESGDMARIDREYGYEESDRGIDRFMRDTSRKPKRKLSAWQRYIKNKRNHITYRDGKLNLKAMGVQYRKKKRR